MRTLTACLVMSILVIGCNSSTSRTDSGMNSATKALYEKNLVSLKAMVSAYEKEDLDTWGSYISDTLVWNPAGYGAVPGTKATWTTAMQAYVAEWDSIRLMNAIFLPGLDQNTGEFDGSVRYYGLWVARHKSGLETSVNYYSTSDFNSDGKLVVYSEFFDLGGLLNAIQTAQQPK